MNLYFSLACYHSNVIFEHWAFCWSLSQLFVLYEISEKFCIYFCIYIPFWYVFINFFYKFKIQFEIMFLVWIYSIFENIFHRFSSILIFLFSVFIIYFLLLYFDEMRIIDACRYWHTFPVIFWYAICKISFLL